MEFDDLYRPSPEWAKQLREDAKLFNKYAFYDEVDKIAKISTLSEEMRLVLEFEMRFQWLEEEAKDLLWSLYSATSETRLNTYMTAQKRDDIRSMYTKDVVKELKCFHIAEDGYREELEGIALELQALSKVRNKITHSLYAEEIKEKKVLITKLKHNLARMKKILKKVENLSRIYMQTASELEIKDKLNRLRNVDSLSKNTRGV